MNSHRQRGVVMVLVAIALVALVAITALALDGAHVVLNKARLQSALDAAALAGAKELDRTFSTAQATTAANSVFSLNAAQYPELLRAVGGGLSMTTTFSGVLPFAAGTTPARFVQTQINGFATTMSLAGVMGINTIDVGGTAVAGPSSSLKTICNITPIMMCGTAGAGPLHGYAVNQVLGLNETSGSSGTDLGIGNYNLLAVGGNGAALVRQNMAGSFSACATIGGTVTTDPGQAKAPVAEGLNTRFNNFGGAMGGTQNRYPPDVIGCSNAATCPTSDTQLTYSAGNVMQGGAIVTTASQISPNYASYAARIAAGSDDVAPVSSNGTGVPQRRVIAAPIGDCTRGVQGRGNIPVLAVACLLLLQPVDPVQGRIFAQVVQSCDVTGQLGTRPGSGSDPHRIQLFKSAGSPDS